MQSTYAFRMAVFDSLVFIHCLQGIRFLEEKGLLNHTPEDIAIFLYANQLDKAAIGHYLGEG